MVWTVPSLAAGASWSQTRAGWAFTTAGPHFLRATADWQNSVTETDEFNNTARDSFTVVPLLPDLVATITVTPNPSIASVLTTVKITVTNIGNASAGPFVVVGLFPGSPWNITGLAPGASASYTDSRAWPAGTFTVNAVVDYYNDVNDTDTILDDNEYVNSSFLLKRVITAQGGNTFDSAAISDAWSRIFSRTARVNIAMGAAFLQNPKRINSLRMGDERYDEKFSKIFLFARSVLR